MSKTYYQDQLGQFGPPPPSVPRRFLTYMMREVFVVSIITLKKYPEQQAKHLHIVS